MHPIHLLFPRWSAAVTQTRAHGESGIHFVQQAVHAPDNGARLDAAFRALNSFDHALTSTKSLPLQRFIPDLGKYRMGYEAAKKAVGLLVGSGVIPGARERIGKQELLAAGDELHRAIANYRADGSRYGRYVALDDLGAAFTDAKSGVALVRKPDIANPLLQGLTDVGNLVRRGKPVGDELVGTIDSLLAQAGTLLDKQIAAAQPTPVAGSPAMVAAAQAQLQSVAGA